MLTFSYSLAQKLWGLVLNLIGWFVHSVECPNDSTTNCNLHQFVNPTGNKSFKITLSYSLGQMEYTK